MRKLLLAMQYYPDDQQRAMAISRLIADIERTKRKDVEFCFAGRFDVVHDRASIQYVSSKFRVHVITSTRREIGWPNGPNGLWHELMVWSQCMLKDNHGDWEAVFTIEADSVPLQIDWLNKVMDEWTRARKEGKFIVGCKIEDKIAGPSYTHINGNAMWDARLTARIPTMTGTPCFRSWDVYHAPTYIKHAFDSPLFKSIHNVEKKMALTEKILYAPRLAGVEPAFFHGAKSPLAEQIVRAKLKL